MHPAAAIFKTITTIKLINIHINVYPTPHNRHIVLESVSAEGRWEELKGLREYLGRGCWIGLGCCNAIQSVPG